MGDDVTRKKPRNINTWRNIKRRLTRYFFSQHLVELEGPTTLAKNIRRSPEVLNVWGLFWNRFLFDGYSTNVKEWILFNCTRSDLIVDFLFVDEAKTDQLVKQFDAITIYTTPILRHHNGNGRWCVYDNSRCLSNDDLIVTISDCT
jgi:hypothetical protein